MTKFIQTNEKLVMQPATNRVYLKEKGFWCSFEVADIFFAFASGAGHCLIFVRVPNSFGFMVSG
jgi:hypothetical protein